jgi:DNA repair photolyase
MNSNRAQRALAEAVAASGARASTRPTGGRGAVSSPAGRFEKLARESVDDGWYREDGEPPALRTEVTEERAGRILAFNDSPDLPFDRSLNPYRGCEHGCTYCFARPTHAWLGLSPGLDFETRLRAKVNAAERLRAELAAPAYRCAPINIGSATDAYQPIERERRLTRAVLEQLSECSHPLTIVTKSSLVERDIDLLAPMARRGLAAVYVSVSTLDPALARAWEPRAAAPWRRLRTIQRLADAGIPVGVAVAPVVPFLNEPELERVLEQAAQAGASSAFYTVLRLPWELREVFVDWLQSVYPDRAARIMNRLGDMRAPGRGGERRLNDPRFFHRMTGQGGWAELVRLRFDLATRKLGLDRERWSLRTDLFVPPDRPARASRANAALAPLAGGAETARAGMQQSLF